MCKEKSKSHFIKLSQLVLHPQFLQGTKACSQLCFQRLNLLAVNKTIEQTCLFRQHTKAMASPDITEQDVWLTAM